MFCGSEDIIQTNIHYYCDLCCDLDLECSNPFFLQETQAYDAVLSHQVWLQTNQHFRKYSKYNHILII